MDLGALTSGLLIGLREGVEAALIVAIVLAYLVRTGNGRKATLVWLGTGAAILASVVIGIAIFSTAGELEEPYEQLFEGTAMLLAAAIVTWMLFWMRSQAAGLSGELRQRVDKALTEGTALGLAVLAFTAVIREGVETSIFLAAQATSVAADASSVGIGAVIGLVIAVGFGWLFYTGSRRINIRTFFRWTGIALVFIAAGLLSHAVHEFLEVAELGGVAVVGSATAFDISAVLSDEQGIGQFLRAIFGYSAKPELLTLVVHVTYLVVVLALYLRPVRPSMPPARASEAPTGRETVAS